MTEEVEVVTSFSWLDVDEHTNRFSTVSEKLINQRHSFKVVCTFLSLFIDGMQS